MNTVKRAEARGRGRAGAGQGQGQRAGGAGAGAGHRAGAGQGQGQAGAQGQGAREKTRFWGLRSGKGQKPNLVWKRPMEAVWKSQIGGFGEVENAKFGGLEKGSGKGQKAKFGG